MLEQVARARRPAALARVSAGCGFRKETIAGMRRNRRDAPILDLPAGAPERKASTQAAIRRAREIDRP
jgi:8-oxo-dGTP pyrophosphatase MutT (NUDIX family)